LAVTCYLCAYELPVTIENHSTGRSVKFYGRQKKYEHQQQKSSQNHDRSLPVLMYVFQKSIHRK